LDSRPSIFKKGFGDGFFTDFVIIGAGNAIVGGSVLTTVDGPVVSYPRSDTTGCCDV
jgi:hypothetical protein